MGFGDTKHKQQGIQDEKEVHGPYLVKYHDLLVAGVNDDKINKYDFFHKRTGRLFQFKASIPDYPMSFSIPTYITIDEKGNKTIKEYNTDYLFPFNECRSYLIVLEKDLINWIKKNFANVKDDKYITITHAQIYEMHSEVWRWNDDFLSEMFPASKQQSLENLYGISLKDDVSELFNHLAI